MDIKESIMKDVRVLYDKGLEIAERFFQKDRQQNFRFEYQQWYTRASRVIRTLANERYAEFKSYYEINPRRKNMGYADYVIQDYLKDLVPNQLSYPKFDARDQIMRCLRNQLSIYYSVLDNTGVVLESIDSRLLSELQDAELETSRQLMKISLRAAGALAGVVIEHHLQKILSSHRLKIEKTNPTINDLTDQLKSEGVIDTANWRKIGYFADIRNICSHKKAVEPKKEQVTELIEGANWVIKNIF